MVDLFKMELFKLRKSKVFWGCCIAIFVICFALPLLGKAFASILMSIVQNGNDPEMLANAQKVVDEYNKPFLFSYLLKAPFGGLSISFILVFISAAVFMHMDIGNGYIKNIAGQIPSRGHSCYGKFAAVCVQALVYMLFGFVGGLAGQLIARGVEFDSEIGSGIGEFLLKWLLVCGLDAILLFFTTGLGNKVLGIVMAAILGTGTLNLIYLPLNYGLGMLFHSDINITEYAPDQMLNAVNINIPAALIGGAALIVVFMFLTVKLLNKKDVK